MRKKLLKKINTLNQNIYIKNYSNFLIYNYLNNLNLKLFFYFFKNKKYFFKNIKNIKLSLASNLNFKKNNLKQIISVESNSFYNNSNFNKFYNNENKVNYCVYNNNLVNTNIKNSNFIYNSNVKYYSINKNFNKNNFLYIVYKELFSLLFLLNLIKIFEFYKNCINLIYLLKLKI